MEDYLDDDCISVVREYSRDLNKSELYVLYVELTEDITYIFHRNNKIQFVYLGDFKIDITIKMRPTGQYDFNLVENLFYNWASFEDKFEDYIEHCMKKEEFDYYKTIYDFIEQIVRDFNLTETEKKLLQEVIYED